MISLIGDLVAVVAAQQVQIDELVYRDAAFLARFSERLLDRLKGFSDTGRDYEGFEVTLDLEDEATEKKSTSQEGSGGETSSSTDARDMHGELKVLANQLGALAAGRQVNVSTLTRRVQKLASTSKSEVRARRKGVVTVKMGKITGKAKDDKGE